MTMAVYQSGALRRGKGNAELSSGRFSSQKFLEQQGPVGRLFRDVALEQRRNLVAKAEQAARLEPDHRQAALDERRERHQSAFRLAPRFIGFADRKKGAAAT